MSVFGLVAAVFQTKTRQLLAGREDPDASLAHSYEAMIVGLQETKRHLADVVAQQRSIERQLARIDAEAAAAQADAVDAMQRAHEAAARAALVHKQDALHRRAAAAGALAAIAPQADALAAYERQLAERIERFQLDRAAAATTYAAARAQEGRCAR